MRLMKTCLTALLAVGILAVNGCATMSQAECENADWQIRGEDDGRKGQRRDYVNEHTKACAEYGIKPDLKTYDAGWQVGIQDFCTRDNGWQHGLSGGSYSDSCPAELRGDFYETYQLASQVHAQKGQISTLEADLAVVNEEIDEVVNDDEKRRKLKKKRGRLKDDLAEAEAELLMLEVEAAKLGYSVP